MSCQRCGGTGEILLLTRTTDCPDCETVTWRPRGTKGKSVHFEIPDGNTFTMTFMERIAVSSSGVVVFHIDDLFEPERYNFWDFELTAPEIKNWLDTQPCLQRA